MYPRHTPVHEALDALGPCWGDRFGMQAALHFGDPDRESQRLSDLALVDLSALPRVGFKGRETAAWLREQGLPCPEEVNAWERLDDGGGLVMRVDNLEYVLEDGLTGGPVRELAANPMPDAPGVYRVERQDASFLLAGAQATRVLAQTCGVNFAEAGGALIRTRVAVTSCMVLRRDLGDIPAYRLWCEPSYAVYLWNTLLDIVRDLGGAPVGMACVEGV